MSRQRGFLSGLAGSLRYGDIAPLVALAPDYLGFRGALCAAGDRLRPLDGERIKKIRAAITRFATMDSEHTKLQKRG